MRHLSNVSEFPDSLLSEDQAAAFLNFTPRFLQMRRFWGGGPPYVRISSRAICYRLSDLKRWIEERIRTSTSDPGDEKIHDRPNSS
jgi:predicted DNA-binding transcriptional regulator AlpA